MNDDDAKTPVGFVDTPLEIDRYHKTAMARAWASGFVAGTLWANKKSYAWDCVTNAIRERNEYFTLVGGHSSETSTRLITTCDDAHEYFSKLCNEKPENPYDAPTSPSA